MLKQLLKKQNEIENTPIVVSGVSFFAESDIDDLETESEFADELQIHEDSLGTAEGQSFIIEYEDASGKRSERAITVHGIREGSDEFEIPLLYAKCGLRKQMRSFRIDRIKEVRDLDGVFEENIPNFLTSQFGMSQKFASLAECNSSLPDTTSNSDQDWVEQRKLIRNHAVLWVLLAFSDNEIHQSEVKAAVDGFVIIVGSKIYQDNFSKYFKNLRPSERQIERAFNALADLPSESLEIFKQTSRNIIVADGNIKSEEVDMLKEIVNAFKHVRSMKS